MFLWCVRDGWRDIYSDRGLLLPIFSTGSQGMQTLTPPCKLVRDASDWLHVPCSTVILCILSKSDHVVLITWSTSGYTPVWPTWPDAPSSSCLLIKMWQLVKGHGVIRNEPKIHVICYITLLAALFCIFRKPPNCRQVLFLLLFLTQGVCPCHLLSVRSCALSSISLSSRLHFKNGPKYLTRGEDCLNVFFSFDEISVAEFGFKKFSSTIFVLFKNFCLMLSFF